MGNFLALPQQQQQQPFVHEVKNLALNDKERLNGGLMWTLTNGYVPRPPKNAYMPVKTSDGRKTVQVPKFVYFDQDRDQKVKTDFKTPDFRDLGSLLGSFMSAGASTRNRAQSLGGVYIPMPGAMNPLAFQLLGVEEEKNGGQLGLGYDSLDKKVPSPGTDLLMANLKKLMNHLMYSNQSQQQGVSTRKNDDLAYRLAKNLVGLLTKEQPKRNEVPGYKMGDVGAADTKSQSTKGLGLFMSVPGLPPSYLGSYVGLTEAEKSNFG
uniref:Uncharacterized protein n=1 Tax=Romanomermis culicivorax TaxID=13658 RepID=A0A915HKW4_ROMCU